jgi:hypothetical protein
VADTKPNGSESFSTGEAKFWRLSQLNSFQQQDIKLRITVSNYLKNIQEVYTYGH